MKRRRFLGLTGRSAAAIAVAPLMHHLPAPAAKGFKGYKWRGTTTGRWWSGYGHRENLVQHEARKIMALNYSELERRVLAAGDIWRHQMSEDIYKGLTEESVGSNREPDDS